MVSYGFYLKHNNGIDKSRINSRITGISVMKVRMPVNCRVESNSIQWILGILLEVNRNSNFLGRNSRLIVFGYKKLSVYWRKFPGL